MPRKKTTPSIEKVDPRARAIRSMSVGWCTLLFDSEFEATLRNTKFNPFVVARREQPGNEFNTLRQWADEGAWCAIESHPEIADADGVPGLDLLIGEDHRVPDGGNWFFSGSQMLALPSGRLRIVYEQEAFEEGYEEEFPPYEMSAPELESFENDEFMNATNYVLSVEPGWYLVHAYTLDFPKKTGDGRHADLVVTLQRTTNLHENPSAKPLIGYAG